VRDYDLIIVGGGGAGLAAGEVLGCGVGKRYFGGGMGICNAMVFGRIAGVNAAAEAKARRAS
jgi:fumarate reductase flavoprotein subunit